MAKEGISPKEAAGWGAVLIGGFLTYKLFNLLGIIETPKEKKRKEEEAAAVARFDDYQKYTTTSGLGAIVTLYKTEQKKDLPSSGGSKILFGNDWATRVQGIAKKIYDSKGVFDDDEDALLSAFRNLSTVGELWGVNDVFNKLYKKQNVFDYIRDFTNEEERAKVTFILDEKPFYLGNKRRN